jgi:hypothetical protein
MQIIKAGRFREYGGRDLGADARIESGRARGKIVLDVR